MIPDEHIAEYECPECDEPLTSKEMAGHECNDTWDDLFPQYYVCGHEVDEENFVEAYLLIPRENGPYYMAYGDSRDYVDEVSPYELYRHDWEYIDREDTPFPEFER